MTKSPNIIISSSISNFREKLLKRCDGYMGDVIFFGLYHWVDYIKFIFYPTKKKVFFCGSDILILKKSFFRYIIPFVPAKYYCENVTEMVRLAIRGIKAEIRPMIFDDPEKYQICYQHSENPRVFGTYHKGREEEYGYFEHPQIDWLCDLPEEEFNEKIKGYQGCIRLNRFDGFAESLAKSVLMGQYQWSEIPYPDMTTTQTLYQWLDDLKNKKVANPMSNHWRERLNQSRKFLLQ